MEYKRRAISLKDKYTIVVRIRGGQTQAAVARKFGLTKSTISGIWKKRDLILKAFEGHKHQLMRLRTLPNDTIDRRLFTWYRARVNADLPIKGILLRKKAEEIAKSIGKEFKCTSKWLDRFKNRHGILFYRKTSQTEDESFRHNLWPAVRIGYTEQNIFAVKEVGIFFKSFPSDKLDSYCDNGEFANSRMTLCICANMSGTEKKPLLIVGNKKCDVNLPIKYKYNKKCWMNLAISLEQLTNWNDELAVTNRKVVLLVRYSPAFRALSDFSHIKIGFHVYDITAHPLDPAVSELKFYYRKYQLQFGTSNLTRIQCIRFLYKSWMRVSTETITNGFKILDGPYEMKKLSLIPWVKKKGLKVRKDLGTFLTFDNNLVTSVHFISDAAEVTDPLNCMQYVYTESSDEEDNTENIKHEEALQMCRKLFKYFEIVGNANLLECIVKVEHNIEDTLDAMDG